MANTKEALLALLKAQPDRPLSGQQAAERLDVSRTAVCKAAAALRRQGYRIEAAPRRGYRLFAEEPAFTAGQLGAFLPGWSAPIEVWPSLPSTDERALALARQGSPAGTVVAALRQTRGQGRFGRTFESPPGGVYLSVVIRPASPLPALLMTAAAAVACAAAVEECCGLRLCIKWVNDLFLEEKKCAGLSALPGEGKGGNFWVVGVGLNLCVAPENFSDAVRGHAASLYAHFSPVPYAEVAAALARYLYLYCTQPNAAILWKEYRRRCSTVGRYITVYQPGRLPWNARAADIAPDFRLAVQLPGGAERLLDTAEVSVRPVHLPAPAGF